MLFEFTLQTTKQEMRNITAQVREALQKSGVRSGLCVVHCPHTTAGITINENADPDVCRDILYGLDAAFPNRPEFRHFEENSHAHLRSGCVGCGTTLIVEQGEPLLGTWQGVYFCEFDGPRSRRFYVKILAD